MLALSLNASWAVCLKDHSAEGLAAHADFGLRHAIVLIDMCGLCSPTVKPVVRLHVASGLSVALQRSF